MEARQEIINQVRRAGVIGAGGAGFPTYFKLTSPCEIYIANGAECEPLLQTDQNMMTHYADEIVAGLRICLAVTDARRGIIGVKEKYYRCINSLDEAISRLNVGDCIKIHLLKDFYPAGDEQVLVYETTGRIVPESGLPLDAGCIVNNVTTLRHIFEAVQGIPVTHRFVSVLGEVHNPRVLNLPIGTPVEDAIQLCGGSTVNDYVVIDGGPMMGKISSSVVRKTTCGLLVLPSGHRLAQEINLERTMQFLRSMSICDQCFACTEVCPRYQLGHRLEPHIVMRDISNGIGLDRINNFLQLSYLCCHCDLCRVWGCPVELAPGKIMLALKSDLQARNISNPYHEAPVSTRNSREGIRPPVAQLINRLGLLPYVKNLEFLPEPQDVPQLRIELNQHIGKPCKPIVNKGDKVQKGQIIADVGLDELGCPVHSPCEGIVSVISPQSIEIHRT